MISVCFLAYPAGGILRADTDAQEASYFHLDDVIMMDLAFDHKKIIEDALKFLKK
jgi:8-oxo-dGTP diphosphatase